MGIRRNAVIVLTSLLIVFTTACNKETDREPVALFTMSSEEVLVNASVRFTNGSLDAEKYLWNFGDEQTSVESSPVHSYIEMGDYTVTLKAYSGNGTKMSEYVAKIKVLPNPENVLFPFGWRDTIEMVKVEGGTFTMGGTSEQGRDVGVDELPAHEVTLSDYYISKYEVTQKQWISVMGSLRNPSYHKGNNTKGSDYPVENVTYEEVEEFLNRLNKQTGEKYLLPTEAQWEFAARGGTKSQGYKFSGSNNIDSVAWFVENSDDVTHIVGQKQPNELGLYDMNGNVWEWCRDYYAEYTDESQEDPHGPGIGVERVIRGGSYLGVEKYNRISNRYFASPFRKRYNRGFRIVLMPKS